MSGTGTVAGGGRAARLARLADLAPDPRHRARITDIFYRASGTRAFASAQMKAVFEERWLGRYLTHDPDLVFVALSPDGEVIGYLVAAVDDPARSARFADIPYFKEAAAVTARFPAHLHVNLDEGWRGGGIGRSLIEALVGDLMARGVPGVHAVTGRDARNVAFYRRAGFEEVAALALDGKPLVMLGRAITPASAA